MPKRTPKSELRGIETCKREIERMMANSQTKLIMPVVTLGLLNEFRATGVTVFTDDKIRKAYETA